MNAIQLRNTNINPEKLHEEIIAVLGKAVAPGLSWTDADILVHIEVEITQAIRDIVDSIVLVHDPAVLTAAQQRRANLKAERIANATPIDPENITLRDIARRLRWLEKEIRAWLNDTDDNDAA